MSGFVSKISAAGSKGWTGLQSLWDRDNKTPLNNSSGAGPPAEKTSLLSLALPSRHPRGSRLLSEDEEWPVDSPSPADDKPATTDDGGASFSSTTTTTTTTRSLTPTFTPSSLTSSPRVWAKAEKPSIVSTTDWSGTSEDESDVWLKGNTDHLGILDTDKKKSTWESKRPSPRFKHKMLSSNSAKGSDWSSGGKHSGERDKIGAFSALGKGKGPSFGKLLDSGEGEEEEEDGGGKEGGGRGSRSTGCENQVWAEDEDEEAQWRMIENRSAPKGM